MSDPLDRFRADWSQPGPPEPPRLTPTFLDLRVGDIAKSPYGASLWWWTEGSGGCDCNRVAGFPDIDDDYEGGDHDETGRCKGCERYVAIDIESDDGPLDDATKIELCAELNEDYADAVNAAAEGDG